MIKVMAYRTQAYLRKLNLKSLPCFIEELYSTCFTLNSASLMEVDVFCKGLQVVTLSLRQLFFFWEMIRLKVDLGTACNGHRHINLTVLLQSIRASIHRSPLTYRNSQKPIVGSFLSFRRKNNIIWSIRFLLWSPKSIPNS